MAWLMRNCDLRTSLIRSEGIYDVLDHATAHCGYGGKVALDLTNVVERNCEPSLDRSALPSNITIREDLMKEWGALLLFADNDLEIDAEAVAKATSCNYIAIFDRRAEKMTANELLWLGAANTEPTRDISLYGATLVIDARAKRPETNGKNPSRWPNIVTSDEATISLVDSRWAEYGIGAFIPSPSERYSSLKLSDGAQWEKQ